MEWNYEEGERGGGDGAVQMSSPHFTCGCGWPFTSFSLSPSISPSLVSHSSVRMSVVFNGMASELHTSMSSLLLLLLLSSIKPNWWWKIVFLVQQCISLVLVQDKYSIKTGTRNNWNETGSRLRVMVTQQLCLQKRFVSKDRNNLIYKLSNLRCKALSLPICNHLNLSLDFQLIISPAWGVKAAVCVSWK